MATSGKKVAMLGLLLALLVVSSQGAVTVINTSGIPVSVLVNGGIVKVLTNIVSVDVKGGASQDIVVKGPNGKDVHVNVKDGDVIVLVPDFTGKGNIVVSVNGQGAPGIP